MQLTSRTIFFFTFRWSANGGLSKVAKAATTGGWSTASPFPNEVYSRKNYLHEFAQDAVYQPMEGHSAILNFQKKLSEPFHIEISNLAIKRPANEPNTTFSPKATFSTLDIYESGIGILSFTLEFGEESNTTITDVLAVNDLGRRLYPQTINQKGIGAAQNSGLIPVSIGFDDAKEDFAAFANLEALPERFLPKYIRKLLGDQYKTEGETCAPDDVLVENVFDDRMFVVSCLANAELSNDFARASGNESAAAHARMDTTSIKSNPDEEKGSKSAHTNDFWYKYVFVDGGDISVRNQEMQNQLLSDATYGRWSEDGTLYGASRYSFVALAGKGWIFGVMTGNYLNLVKICLAQRANVLHFRQQATDITGSIASGADSDKITEKIRFLHGDFIRFSNRLNFREVTTYEQGIELYDLIRRQMRIAEQVEGLKEELADLHAYATQLQESASSNALEGISLLGALFLIPSFLLTYFGFYDRWKVLFNACHSLLFWWLFVGAACAILVFFGGKNRIPAVPRRIALSLLVLYLLASLLLPLLLEWYPEWIGVNRE
jgi:hypothetical protein